MTTELNFKGGNVFLNGETIFEIPIKHRTMDTVTAVCFCESIEHNGFSVIYVGTGTYCHGHLYKLVKHEGPYVLDEIISVDANVEDILPVSFSGVLVAGHGCVGAGVRLIDTDGQPFMVNMVSGEQYLLKLCSPGYHSFPVFRVDTSDGTIHLDSHTEGARTFSDLRRTMNLTWRLKKAGVDMQEAIEIASSSYRLRSVQSLVD